MDKTTVTLEYLSTREKNIINAGYPSPKWIGYCRSLIESGLRVQMYEAKQTVSKYIYSSNGTKVYKVRFSNHKPSFTRQQKKDCDFFVGVSYGLVTKTEDALKETLNFFKL